MNDVSVAKFLVLLNTFRVVFMNKEWTEVRKKTGTVKAYSRVLSDGSDQRIQEIDTYQVVDDGTRKMWVENFSFTQLPPKFGWFDLNSIYISPSEPEWIELWIGGSVMAQTLGERGKFVNSDHLFIPLCAYHETRIRAAYNENPDSQSTCSLIVRTGSPPDRLDIELDLEYPPPTNRKQVISFGAGIAVRRYNVGPRVVYCD